VIVQDWLAAQLGFSVRERVTLDSGFVLASWMAVTPLVHDIAVIPDSMGRLGRFHHLAYYLDNVQDIFRGCDILREQGVAINAGPGKHGISHASFLYVKDPGSGHRVELFSGGYLVFDPDWEPIEWEEKELADALIWWGSPLPADFLDDSTGSDIIASAAAATTAPAGGVR
jgi:biphenyl-2,3-diol 1,2-dioxygenase